MRLGATAVHGRLGSARVARTEWGGVAPWDGDANGEFREPFLDLAHLTTVSGASMSVNVPARDGASPLFPTAGANVGTWDYQKLYVGAVFDGESWHLVYSGADVSGSIATDRTCYATSTDGVTWTKPNLGLVTYSGDTNNNILFQGRLTSCEYHSDLSLWVATVERDGDSNLGIFIYTSPSPNTGWTLVKTISPGSTFEGKALLRRDDGRWIAYMTGGHDEDLRHIDAWLSTTTDIAGAYSSVGALLTASASTDQRYSIGIHRTGDIFYGLVMRYNSTSGTMQIDLYLSRDGLSWTLTDNQWMAVGTTGAFDDEMIWGPSIVEVDNTWWIYYSGSPVVHGAARPKDMRIGRASIPKGRIGQVMGTGVVTTAQMLPTSGQTLSVNCDANGGTIEIEILDQFGQTISGYTQAASTDITTDTYAITPSWVGSLAMPTDAVISLRFHLTAATLYGYTII